MEEAWALSTVFKRNKGTNSHIVLHRSIHNLLVGRCLIWGPRGLSESYGGGDDDEPWSNVRFVKQTKINTRSSTEAELVGVNDAMTMILWAKHFLEAQGYPVQENIIYQDNESSMKLEKYGRQSSGKKTRHLDRHYYFVTDNVKKGTVQI